MRTCLLQHKFWYKASALRKKGKLLILNATVTRTAILFAKTKNFLSPQR